MGLTGMDVEQVQGLAGQLGQAAEEVLQVAQELTARLGTTTWVGADRTRFDQEWASAHRPGLQTVAEALHGAAASASASAQDQDRASR
jgi:uncharacterized protein YukE